MAIEIPSMTSSEMLNKEDHTTTTAIDATTGFSAEKAGDDGWLLDSGATKSITRNINDFVEYHQWEAGQRGYAYSDVHGKLTKSTG